MKVLDKKVSRGRTFVILCNTMNGFLRPAEAHMISFLAPNAPPAEPLFTAADAFTFTALPGDRKPETVTLAGNLCTAADIIAEDISLPGLERGDAVAVPNAGCYAAALSPMGFSSQTPPAELLLGTDGIVRET
jgi:diaminopimelate decarboxylase